MARAQGARAQMALAYETTYGTAPASGYFRMPFTGATLASEQALLASEVLGLQRDPQAPQFDAMNVDGNVSVPVDAVGLGYWLKGLFGDPTTTGAGPYTHVFNSGGWSLPSMSIEVGNPDVPSYRMFSGVVADSIAISAQRTGLLTAEIGLIGQSEANDFETNAGTPSAVTLTRFGMRQATITRDGSALADVVSIAMTYRNNLDRIEVVGNGGLIAAAEPSVATLEGTLTMRFADTTVRNAAIAGTPCALVLAFGNGTHTVTFNAYQVYLSRPRLPIEGPGGIQQAFDFIGAYDPTATRMCRFTVINGLADY